MVTFERMSISLLGCMYENCVYLLSAFGVRVSVMFLLTYVHIIFSSVSVAEWPLFGK